MATDVAHAVRISTEATALLMEAACNYAHDIYADSFQVTETSGKRRCLMMRDLHATLHAKRDSMVAPRTRDSVVAPRTSEDAAAP